MLSDQMRWHVTWGLAVLAATVLPGVAAAAPFSPTDVAGLDAWLQASLGVTTNIDGYVTGWIDQTGNGNNGTDPGANNRPTLNPTGIGGLPAIDFRGSTSDFLPVGLGGSTGTDIKLLAIVFNNADTIYPQAVVGANTGQYLSGLQQTNGHGASTYVGVVLGDATVGLDNELLHTGYDGARRGWTDASGSIPAGDHLFLMRYNGTAYDFMLDGEWLPMTGASFLNEAIELTLGKRHGDTLFNFNGQIAEVLLYNQDVSEANAVAIGNHLMTTYGIPEPMSFELLAMSVLALGAMRGPRRTWHRG